MRINKIICDKCGKEILEGEEIRVELKQREYNEYGRSNGFKKIKEYEICQECFVKLTANN